MSGKSTEKLRQSPGYFAVAAAGSTRPVLVLHAWWGLNDTARAFCDRLAASGFTVFAPDLYHGQTADTVEDAEKLAGALDARADEARKEITAAARFLSECEESGGRNLAVIGFSLGAFYALDLSAADPDLVRAVVIYYGTGPADFSRARAAYLGHYAEADPYEPEENVRWLESALEEAGRPVTFHRYPGVGHWFCEPDRADAFDEEAAEVAWERTQAFLRGI